MAKKIIFFILVISWMTVIFAFSAQPAVESDGISMNIVGRIISFLESFFTLPAFSDVALDSFEMFAQMANHYVRKCAHFTIFAILGIFVYNLFASYDIVRKKVLLISFLVCLLYAISDEIHQLYVPGRAGQIKDVIIDFSGSVTSIGIIYFFFGRFADKGKKKGRHV